MSTTFENVKAAQCPDCGELNTLRLCYEAAQLHAVRAIADGVYIIDADGDQGDTHNHMIECTSCGYHTYGADYEYDDYLSQKKLDQVLEAERQADEHLASLKKLQLAKEL